MRSGRFFACLLCAVAFAMVSVTSWAQNSAPPVAGPNVNMVSGTAWPGGDPFLQRQNEPSMAVSTRSPLHLLAGANDYRTVDLSALTDSETGDAWIGVFRSTDGGRTWRSTLLQGCPYSIPECNGSPIKALKLQAASDPVVRAGTNGMFYLSFIASNRGNNPAGVVGVARFIDDNNKERIRTGNEYDVRDEPVRYVSTAIADDGNQGRFLDKPWLAVDIPRDGAGTCTIPGGAGTPDQTIPAGNVYLAYSVFVGNDINTRTKILFTRSTDCGATWSNPIKLSEGFPVNQGTMAAVDPVSGAVYVAWRQLKNVNNPDAILVAKSVDGGRTFTKATQVASFEPFDQGTTSAAIRTIAFPMMAVDGNGRFYLAWPARVGPLAIDGKRDGRIVVSTSSDGVSWSTPVAVDNPPSRGHQFMPAITVVQGKVLVGYYDQQEDSTAGELRCLSAACQATPPESRTTAMFDEVRVPMGDLAAPAQPGKVFANPFMDAPPSGFGFGALLRRHTIDVRVAQADVPLIGAPTFAPSVRVSQYLFGSSSQGTDKTVRQLRFNVPNLPLFALGTKPFLGDYTDLAALAFLPPNTTAGAWTYNVNSNASDSSPVVHQTWTDNRDVRPPADGNWQNYTPLITPVVGPAGPACAVGQAGMKDQNIYTSRITQGLLVGSLGNSKTLGYKQGSTTELLQRAFVVFVQNATNQTRYYRLTIANQPAGGQASFLQSGTVLTTLDVAIARRSSISRTVFATSTDPHARITVNVTEITGLKGGPVSNGLKSFVLLNGDITNPNPVNGDITNGDITNHEAYNGDLTNLGTASGDLTNGDLTNGDITNGDITNGDITNGDLTNGDITNGDLTNMGQPQGDLTNGDITNGDLTNGDITNGDITNGNIVDVTWKLTNRGNTSASYHLKTLLKGAIPTGFKTQLILHKSYTTPVLGVTSCKLTERTQTVVLANIPNPVFIGDLTNGDLTNGDITNGDLTNATLALAPGETAKITLRMVDPNKTAGVNVCGDITRYDPVARKLVKVNVPCAAGDFSPGDAVKPIVQPAAINTDAPARVGALVIATLSLPDAVQGALYTQTLQAIGGSGARTWSITYSSDAPPTWLSMDPAATGVISGTPTATGLFKFQAKVVDSSPGLPQDDTQNLSIRVAAPLLITTASPLPDGVIGAFYDLTLQASGGTAPLYWALPSGGTWPSGLTLDSATGRISGYPGTAGIYTFNTQVSDSGTPPQSQPVTLTIRIAAPVTITSASPPDGLWGSAYNQTLTSSGGAAPLSWSIISGSLPPPLTLSATGIITGTPTGTGMFTFTVQLSDGSSPQQIVTKTLSIRVSTRATTTVVTLLPNTLVVGQPSTVTVYVTDAEAAGTKSNPTGIVNLGSSVVSDVFSSTTCALVPVSPTTDKSSCSVTVTPAVASVHVITGSYGGSTAHTASSDTAPLTVLTPPDLIVDSLTHSPSAPTTADLITFTAVVKNVGAGAAGASTLEFRVGGETPAAPQTQFAVPALAPGASYTVQRQLTLSVAQNYRNTATADINNAIQELDETNNVRTDDYTVVAPLVISTAPLPTGTFNRPYSASLQTVGGTAPFTWSLIAGSLPSGVTLNASTGQISGNYPAGVGTFPVTIQVRDSSSPARTATVDLSIVINPPNLVFTVQPSNTVALQPIAPAVKILAVDPNGVPVPGVPVVLTIGTNPGGATLSGALTASGMTDVTGFVSFANLVLDRAGNGCTLVAGSVGTLRVTSAPFNILPAPGFIMTVAGSAWRFSGDGGPATNAALGKVPWVVMDSAGNLFASDRDNHLVVKISPSGTLTVVAGNGLEGYSGDNGPATSASLRYPNGLALDSAGNLYISDWLANVVRKVSPSGIITTVAGGGNPSDVGDGGPATSAGLYLPAGLAVDATGTLYIAVDRQHRIRAVSPAGIITTVAGNGIGGFSGDNGPATAASLNQPGDVSFDAAGNLYICDSGNQRVRKVSGGTIVTVVGSGSWSAPWGDGGPATAASLIFPREIAFDAAGNLYIAEQYGNRIRKVTGGTITTIAGGVAGFSGDGGPAAAASLRGPSGVAVDAAGNVYIADTGNYRVRKITSGTITTIAGNGSFRYGGDGGPGTSAFLYQPNGLAMDSSGSIYIADTSNNRVRKLAATGVITTIAGNGMASFGGDGGPATNAALNSPYGVAVDAAGNVYIADVLNYRIRRVTPGGLISTIAGNGSLGFSGDSGPATNASLASAMGVGADAAGNVYIADTGNYRVRKVTPAGIISTVAGNGLAGYSGDGGPALSASLNGPWGVNVDAAGNIYIAEIQNYRVRLVTPGGIITTIAGHGTQGSFGDGGPATAAVLSEPRRTWLDAAGNLYIADAYRVRRVTLEGIISTIAGTGTSGPLGDGGPATAATLYGSHDVVVDAAGNVYVADTENNRVRMVLATPPAPLPGTRLTLTTTSLPPATSGVSYSASLTVVGATNPLTFSLTSGALPAGLTLNGSTGQISGTPSSAGSFDFVVAVTMAGSTQSSAAALTIQVVAPLTITTGSLPDGMTGTAYSRTVASTGGLAPLSWSTTSGALPAGLALNAGTGAISGTPTAEGTFSFTVQVSDSSSPTVLRATQSLAIRIAAPLTITTTSLPTVLTNTPYHQVLTSTGGTRPVSWSLTGWALSSAGLTWGLTVAANGEISGTIGGTGAGWGRLTVTVTDSSFPTLLTTTQTLNFQVADPLSIATASLPDGEVNWNYGTAPYFYGFNLAANGGSNPLSWSLASGSLPPGVQLGAPDYHLGGTPTAAGTYNFRIQVMDSSTPAQTALKDFSIVVYPLLVFQTTTIADALTNASYNQPFVVTGGRLPYTWQLNGTLPPGLTFTPAADSAVISGTPTANGDFSFHFYINDSIGRQLAPPGFTLHVKIAPGELIVGDSYRVIRIAPTGSNSNVVNLNAFMIPSPAMALNAVGDIVVAGGTAIRKVTPLGRVYTIFSGPPLTSVVAVAVDDAGYIIAADNSNDVIYRISPDGSSITPIVNLPTTASLQNIELAVDAAGNLIFAHDGLGLPAPLRVQRRAPDGTITTIYSGADVSATYGVAVDLAGNYLVAGYLEDTIVRITPAGVVSVFARGPSLHNLSGLAVEASGNVVSVSGVDKAVVRVVPGGVASTVLSGPPLTNPARILVYR